MLSIKDIKKINKPIVWTMHEHVAVYRGCHYSDSCILYEKIVINVSNYMIKKTLFE